MIAIKCKMKFKILFTLFQLCLMSGEIIQMSNKMNLIFEPADLEQASPATVSRCGMIYLEPHQLGWAPFKDSYMEHVFPKNLLDEHRQLVNDLFTWLVQPCLDFIRHECKLLIQTSEIHLVRSLMILYDCLMDEIKNSGQEGHETLTNQQLTLWLQGLFLFSLVWTIGGTMTGDSRKKFDVYFRTLISGTDDAHPKPKSTKISKVSVWLHGMFLNNWAY